MKNKGLYLTTLFVLMLVSVAFGTELDEVYKHYGSYSYVEAEGLRIYYPDSLKEAIPRIASGFSRIRNRLVKVFEKDNGFAVSVILNEHDDIVESTADSKFDFINLCVFDEMDTLSARSYSLEKRFALSLAKTLIKKSSSNVSFQWRRFVAMLLMPHWFVEGCALNYAFPMDTLQYSRLLDMARNGNLYSLDDLNTITSQTTLAKEEMLFQAHSMLAYWESTFKKGADLELIKSIVRKPVGFETAFKKYYGVSLAEAYDSYVKYISLESGNLSSFTEPNFLDVDYLKSDNKIFRSYLRISDDERIWVSSQRYTTENYDLYYRKGIQKPIILLRNVHPGVIYDYANKEIVIACYSVMAKREKRLTLWRVTLDGRARCISSLASSFKPLGIKDGRVYFLRSTSGAISVMSVSLNENKSEKTEVSFGIRIRPLDVALDFDNNRVFFTFQSSETLTHLAYVPLYSKDIEKDTKIIHSWDGEIRALNYCNGRLWFAFDKNHTTIQLFSWNEKEGCLEQYTNLPGGVWDIKISGSAKNTIDVTTLNNGGFSIASVPLNGDIVEKLSANSSFAYNEAVCPTIKTHRYRTEFSTSLWKPALGKDASGNVIGVYSMRTDRLGRSSIVLAPTYGLKSHKWGYTSDFMRRFDLLKVDLSFNDYTTKRSYMDNDYYERVKSNRFGFEYPLRLDMALEFGFDLAKRSISKNEGGGLVPTAGKDHYYFINVKQKSIRTEPYNNIFPRKGRLVEFRYKRGDDTLFGGDMLYDSLALKWDEYIPLNSLYVLTLSSYMACDNKLNDIRRPEDLSLGGEKYMRAFDDSYDSGDNLRYVSIAIARPVRLELPRKFSSVRNEFSTIGVFYELGDVKSEGKFDYYYDRGLEVTSKLLLFKRIPTSFKAGYAVRNGQKEHDTYFNFYFDDLKEVLD